MKSKEQICAEYAREMAEFNELLSEVGGKIGQIDSPEVRNAVGISCITFIAVNTTRGNPLEAKGLLATANEDFYKQWNDNLAPALDSELKRNRDRSVA